MKKLLILAPLLLGGCVTSIDPCKYATESRMTLVATITATQILIDENKASNAVRQANAAARAALDILNTRCPVVNASATDT